VTDFGAFQEEAFQEDAFQIADADDVAPGWQVYVSVPKVGRLHVGKFAAAEPLYTLRDEIINYDSVDDGRLRANVVMVDGQEDSWTEYDRADLISRDVAVAAYLDLPELTNAGAVRQRAVEELEQARVVISPGGEIAGPMVLTTTRMDPIFWIDEYGNRYQTRVEGKAVSFDQGRMPRQHATIDTGAQVFCPPDETEYVYLARDNFERADDDELGEAQLGGNWVIYT
jgi:hypothetical protein